MRWDRRALDAAPFSSDQLAAFAAAVDVNDVVDTDIVEPQSVDPHYRPEQLVAAFRLARQWWREGFDPEALTAITGKLRAGHVLDDADRKRFKDIRARFKQMRFAFVLYARDHRCPVMFKAVTTMMGQLQDSFKQDLPQTARKAALLELLLTRPSLTLIDRSVDRLIPCDGPGYARFVDAQMAMLRTTLAQATATTPQFHAARKIVSRQVSFHDAFRVLFPAREHEVMSRYLSAINGLMGRHHDDLVAQHAQGKVDYARAASPLSDDIRQRLTVLVGLYA